MSKIVNPPDVNRQIKSTCYQIIALPFAFGLISSLLFAPFLLWPLLIPIYSGLFWLLKKSKTKQCLYIGLSFGAGMYISCFHWLYSPAYEMLALSAGDASLWWLHPAALGVMLTFMLSLAVPLAAACLLFRSLSQRVPNIFAPWLFAFCIVIAEYLRGFPFWPFLPWNITAYALADTLPLIQLASLASAGLVSFLALGIATSFTEKKQAKIALSIFACWFAGGSVYLHMAPIPTQSADYLLRAVQAETSFADGYSSRGKRNSFLTHFSVSRDPTENTPDIILWPEGAVRYVLADEPFIVDQLNSFEPELIFGSMVSESRSYKKLVEHPNAPRKMVEVELTEDIYFNSIFQKKAGEPIDLDNHVRKRIAVPVGEQLPLMEFFEAFYDKALPHFSTIVENKSGVVYLDTALGRALVLNCYEALFSRIIWRDSAKADLLLHITNDAWYSDSVAREQFFYIARLRAIEAGKPLIRVANKGINGFFDAYGRILYRFDPEVLPLPNDMEISKEMLSSKAALFPQRD